MTEKPALSRPAVVRRLAWLVAPALPLAWAGSDALLRARIFPHLTTIAKVNWAAGVLLSIALWVLLFEAARDRRRLLRWGGLLLCFLIAGFGIGGQLYVRDRTHGYINRDAVVLSLRWPGIIGEHMLDDFARVATFFIIPALLVPLLALLRGRILGPLVWRPNIARAGVLGALVTTAFSPLYQRGLQCLPPDVLLVHAAGGLALHAFGLAPEPRTCPAGKHEALPDAPLAPDDAPPIVVIFGESIRRDEVCVASDPACARSPHLDREAPHRIGYGGAFSTSSCTEIATVSLFTGLPVTADIVEVARAPLLWDYAKARGYRTGYFGSHNLAFANLDRFLGTSRIDELREARDREAAPDMDVGTPDEVTCQEALEHIRRPGPSLTVLHLANTHSPYREPAGGGPFQPTRAGGSVDALTAMRNRYRNSLVLHDQIVGDFLRELRADANGRRAIVIYLADHGEAWGEHGAMGHTYDLYEEQIAIPLWIDVPEGALTEETIARMRIEAPLRSVISQDATATVVDLLGGFDFADWQEKTERLAGTSLLRPPDDARSVVMWNCPPFTECSSNLFAIRRGSMKLQWLGKEMRFVCHDLDADPEEKVELPIDRCMELRRVADNAFGAENDGV